MDPWLYWKDVLQSPKFTLAPMVDHSELPWRMLSREYGCDAAYTPMFHGASFAKSKKFRQKMFSTCPEDRPLIVQFCANQAEVLLDAAKFVENQCDGVDINLGCPQDIARRGHYGAFLQEDWNLIREMVVKLRCNLRHDLGVSCKIRRFDELNRTIDYARMLELAGCTFICLHARTREQRGVLTGSADWGCIKSVKQSVNIPVIANGNVQSMRDAEACLSFTGADAVMTAEGNLYNPALFNNTHLPAWDIARRYLYYVDKYPVPVGMAKSHIFKLFHRCMAVEENAQLRSQLGASQTLEQLHQVIDEFERRYKQGDGDLSVPITVLPVPPYLCQPRFRYNVPQAKKPVKVDDKEEDGSAKCVASCQPDGAQKRIKLGA